MAVARTSVICVLGFALLAFTGGVAKAQPPSNNLAPGIAPLAPKALPPSRASALAAAAPPETSRGPAEVAPASSATPPASQYDYVLGAGDKLRIVVFGEDNLSGEFTVAGNGSVSFPLIGEVRAAGRPVSALRAAIEQSLRAGYIKDPRVSAEVLTFRPYFMLGEVGKPGEYPYSDGLTVMNAVAAAGGFTYRANQKYIFIKHPGEPDSHRVRLNEGLTLSPGDTVRVSERLF